MAAVLATALTAGCFPREGEGFVEAEFSITDCPPGDENGGLADYRYDARFLGTTRFNDQLSLQIFEHRSLPEETDGLAIWLDLADLRDQGLMTLEASSKRFELNQSPIVLPVPIRWAIRRYQRCAQANGRL